MTNFIKKHGVAITCGVAAVVVISLGLAFFFPTQTVAALIKVKTAFIAAGAWIKGLFSRGGGQTTVSGDGTTTVIDVPVAVEPVVTPA